MTSILTNQEAQAELLTSFIEYTKSLPANAHHNTILQLLHTFLLTDNFMIHTHSSAYKKLVVLSGFLENLLNQALDMLGDITAFTDRIEIFTAALALYCSSKSEGSAILRSCPKSLCLDSKEPVKLEMVENVVYHPAEKVKDFCKLLEAFNVDIFQDLSLEHVWRQQVAVTFFNSLTVQKLKLVLTKKHIKQCKDIMENIIADNDFLERFRNTMQQAAQELSQDNVWKKTCVLWNAFLLLENMYGLKQSGIQQATVVELEGFLKDYAMCQVPSSSGVRKLEYISLCLQNQEYVSLSEHGKDFAGL